MLESKLSIISSDSVRSVLYEIIENEIQSKDYTVEVEEASKSGATNFVGIVYRIHFKKGNGDEFKQKSLIFKTAPQHLARRKQFYSRPCFVREIYMYREILPYFLAFDQSRQITYDDVRNSASAEYPKCYRTIDLEPDECLFFEDMKPRGFTTIDQIKGELSVDHVRLYLQSIAKFHAVSLALKDQQPEKFHKLTSHLGDVFIQRDIKSVREYYEEQAQYVLTLFSADEDAHLLNRLKNFFVKDAIDICVDCIELEAAEPAAVVTHGDSNLHNILFKYDSNGKPTEICLIDWQMSRLASPITDIIYFIFISVTKDVRDAHYDDLLTEYHESLSTHIKRLGSDPEKLFPYEVMQKHFKKFAKNGLILAFKVLQILTSDLEGGADLDELSDAIESGKITYSSMSAQFGEKYNKRMRDIVIDMVRLGYI